MRITGKIPNLLVPPVLQNIFDRDLVFFLGFPFFKGSRYMFWVESAVICASRSGEPVYLIDLLTDLPALFKPRCAMDCNGDVEDGGGNGKATELSIL
jgi:hypothetical protein